MNRKPQLRFEPSSRLLRAVFAGLALMATIATGAFIDALAEGYGTTSPPIVNAASAVVAQR